MSFLSAVADVFDKLAEEAEKAPKVAAAPAAKPVDPTVVKVAAVKLREALGKDATPSMLSKVAGDKELLDVVEKLAAERNRPETMGGPADDVKTASPYAEKNERLSNTFDAWGSAISRNG